MTTTDTGRRERYADAIRAMGPARWDRMPGDIADAVMPVADRELTQVREALADATGSIAEMQRDIARLRKQAAEVRAAALTEPERRFLGFALDQAAEEMSLNEGFTDDDEAALESLRRMAAAARPDDTTGA